MIVTNNPHAESEALSIDRRAVGIAPGRRPVASMDMVARLRRALHTVAPLVSEDEAYLPIFERLEAELVKADTRQASLARARAIAAGADQKAMR